MIVTFWSGEFFTAELYPEVIGQKQHINPATN
jgi:hypothetical protein